MLISYDGNCGLASSTEWSSWIFEKPAKFCKILQILKNFSEIIGFLQFFSEFSIFSENFGKILKIQLAHSVDLEKCCKMSIWLQKLVLIQPRTGLGKSDVSWPFDRWHHGSAAAPLFHARRRSASARWRRLPKSRASWRASSVDAHEQQFVTEKWWIYDEYTIHLSNSDDIFVKILTKFFEYSVSAKKLKISFLKRMWIL